MPNLHPIVFKFCAYVNYMLIYNMHRERKFPMTITNFANVSSNFLNPPRTCTFFSECLVIYVILYWIQNINYTMHNRLINQTPLVLCNDISDSIFSYTASDGLNDGI